MFDPSCPEQPTPGADPLRLMTDSEYQDWLESSERRPLTEDEQEEIQSTIRAVRP